MAQDSIREIHGRFEALYPPCQTDGCYDVAESRDGFCNKCASDREWGQRMAARRKSVEIERQMNRAAEWPF